MHAQPLTAAHRDGEQALVPRATRTLQRFETGVPNLDRVLGGGLLRGTVVMVIGPPGSGKTILAQQIACHAGARGEVALYFTGYSETHDKLLAHNRSLSYFAAEAGASTFGIDLASEEAAGRMQVLTVAPHDLDADLVAWLIREHVEERGVRRLVIDSATELEGRLTYG